MTIKLTREEAQQVLDALNSCGEDYLFNGEDEYCVDVYDYDKVDAAKETLRTRLAQPEPEPVAYVAGYYAGHCVVVPVNPARVLNANTALYTAPPKREWQGLTDEEAMDIEQWSPDVRWAIIRTEAKLKEKNT